MLFFIGDKVNNTVRDRKGVIVNFKSPEIALVDYESYGVSIASVKNLKLLSTPNDVQKLTQEDPEVLTLLAVHFKERGGRIEICCPPSSALKVAADMSANSSLSELDALDYIKLVSEQSEGPKYDLLLNENLPEELEKRFCGIIWKYGAGKRARRGEAQINSKCICLWLMKEHGVLPKYWA